MGLEEDRDGQGGGCHLKTSTGFLLVMLAMAGAVGVGVIVHFAGGGAKPIVCQCEWQSQATPSVAQLRDQCQQLAQSYDDAICKACDSHKTTMTTIPTSSQTSLMTSSAATTSMKTTSLTSAPTTTKSPPVNYRLPGDVTPEHYWLELQPHIYSNDSSTFTFNGSVTVRMRAETATSRITLHSRGLTVPRETMELKSETEGEAAPAITNVRNATEQEFLILELSTPLTPSHKYLLTMTFSGNLTGSGVGLYWSSYTDGNDTIYLATSKFEAPYARRAFPCFDEPRMKATFDVTLVRRNDTSRDYRSFSNEDLWMSEYRGGGWVADKFLRTPPMSTYLLAFVVSDFLLLSNTSSVSGIQYRTLARPNAIQNAHYAQTVGLELYDWLETTFDPPYNLSKLDNIAIPDFLAGAMENWGLITYRETLLYEEGVSTASDRDWVVEVIAHELTHMWFGNVVSPKWWSWLWLNEAFASFFDTIVVDKLHPGFRKMEQLIVQSVHATMYTDSSVTSHPITASVESPSEVQDIFDSITYTKGACIVRLMYHILGEDTFFRGLNRYLDRHQYSVAEHQDLWNALTEQAAMENRTINVTDVMDPWVTQQNFPVVYVNRSRDFAITVTQRRYLRSPDLKDDGIAMYGYQWNVPITVASSVHPDFSPSMLFEDVHWLDRRQPSLEIRDNATLPPLSDGDSWVLVNLQQLGFYRVNYHVSNWEALIRQLRRDHTVIPPVNRAQIINDAWSLAKAEQLNLSIAFRTLDFLQNDTDYVPWRALHRELGTIDQQLRYSNLYGDFTRMMRRLMQKPFDKVGFDVDTSGAPVTIFESTRFVTYACQYGLPSCVNAAVERFRNWSTNSARIHPDRQYTVFCTAVRVGDEAEWNIVLDHYRRADSATEKLLLLTSLACTWQPWLLNRLLAMTLDPNEIKSQDIRTVINAVSDNLVGRDLAWLFLRANYRELVSKLTSSQLSSVIATVTTTFNTEAQLKDLEAFIAANDVKGGASALKRAVESTKENVHWLETNYNLVRDWLASNA